MTPEELRSSVDYKVGTEENMTGILLSDLGSKMEASITTTVQNQSRVVSKMPLGLELIFSLIRVGSGPESEPDLSLNWR